MRALITGLSRASGRAQVVRAALESVPLQIHDLLKAMAGPVSLRELRVDGGPSGNSFLMQLQADLLEVPVMVASTDAASARGAAFLAGRSAGIWLDIAAIIQLLAPAATYLPAMSAPDRRQVLSGWQAAIRQTLSQATDNADSSPHQ